MSIVRVPVYVPKSLIPSLRWLKRSVVGSSECIVDLSGDRDIEWSFVAGHLPCGPGEALDFGSGGTYLSLIAARRGFSVVALDLKQPAPFWQHPNRRVIEGDLLEVDLQNAKFDLVINCSSVEHVGLVGRYSVSDARPDGDLEAMRRLRKLMKPGAIQLLTIPLGRDAVFQPWHRVYGEKRLPLLLQGYRLVHAEFWCKSQDRTWITCGRQEALSFGAAWDRQRKIYALGCFVLQRPIETSA